MQQRKRDVLAVVDGFAARQRVRRGAPAQARMLLDERNSDALLGERDGCRQAGETAADDDYVWRRHNSGFHKPAPARTMIQGFLERSKVRDAACDKTS